MFQWWIIRALADRRWFSWEQQALGWKAASRPKPLPVGYIYLGVTF